MGVVPDSAYRRRSLSRGAWPLAVIVALASCSGSDAPSVGAGTTDGPVIDEVEATGSTVESVGEGEMSDTVDAPTTAAGSSPLSSPAVATSVDVPTVGTVVDGNVEVQDPVLGDGLSSSPPTTGVVDAINITVPTVPVEIAEPVDLEEPAEFGNGVEIRIVRQKSIEVTTVLPGEIGGPSVLFELEFVNRSNGAVDLSNVIVDLVLEGGASASPITSDPAARFEGLLVPDGRRQGTYVFSVPADRRGIADLRISYSASAPQVVLTGGLPSA